MKACCVGLLTGTITSMVVWFGVWISYTRVSNEIQYHAYPVEYGVERKHWATVNLRYMGVHGNRDKWVVDENRDPKNVAYTITKNIDEVEDHGNTVYRMTTGNLSATDPINYHDLIANNNLNAIAAIYSSFFTVVGLRNEFGKRIKIPVGKILQIELFIPYNYLGDEDEEKQVLFEEPTPLISSTIDDQPIIDTEQREPIPTAPIQAVIKRDKGNKEQKPQQL